MMESIKIGNNVHFMEACEIQEALNREDLFQTVLMASDKEVGYR